MKKRIVSLILCGLMVFSAAGCSGGGENKAGKDDVTLTMWTHINEPWNAAYKDAIKEFESENEGVRIKLETFPYDEFESKVQTALIDGEGGADIYELWTCPLFRLPQSLPYQWHKYQKRPVLLSLR